MKGYKQFALQFTLNDNTGLNLGTALSMDIYICYYVLRSIMRVQRLTGLAGYVKGQISENHWKVQDQKELREMYYGAIHQWFEANVTGSVKRYKVPGIELPNALQKLALRVASGSSDLSLYFSYTALKVTGQVTHELSAIADELKQSGEPEYTMYLELFYFTVLCRCKYPHFYQ